MRNFFFCVTAFVFCLVLTASAHAQVNLSGAELFALAFENPQKMAALMQESAKKGFVPAKAYAGLLYYDEDDLVNAARWLTDDIVDDDINKYPEGLRPKILTIYASAYAVAGEIFEHGLYVPVDLQKAKTAYKKAVELGGSPAENIKIWQATPESLAKAENLLEDSCDSDGVNEDCLIYAMIHKFNLLNKAKPINVAGVYRRLLANRPGVYAKATSELAALIFDGALGKKNEAEGYAMTALAAMNGDEYAKIRMEYLKKLVDAKTQKEAGKKFSEFVKVLPGKDGEPRTQVSDFVVDMPKTSLKVEVDAEAFVLTTDQPAPSRYMEMVNPFNNATLRVFIEGAGPNQTANSCKRGNMDMIEAAAQSSGYWLTDITAAKAGKMERVSYNVMMGEDESEGHHSLFWGQDNWCVTISMFSSSPAEESLSDFMAIADQANIDYPQPAVQ